MRALIVHGNDKMELGSIPEPKPGPFEALVRIRGCGICATTDWELIHGRQPYHSSYPAVLGHEAIGEVVELGSKVTSFRVGDLVTRPVAIWPGKERDGFFSAWGGFADYGFILDRVAMQAENDTSFENDYTALRQNVVPAGIKLPEAILAISLAETASWFRHLPSVGGKSVCIAGTGIAGLSMIIWSVFSGAKNIIVLGRRDSRLQLALELGASYGVNITKDFTPQRVRELNSGLGADFFLEAVGLPDQVQVGLSVLAPGGVIAIYGVPEGQRYELDWSAGPGAATIAQYPAQEHLSYEWVTKLMLQNLIPTPKLMTHSWPLDKFRSAFEAVSEGSVVKGWLEI